MEETTPAPIPTENGAVYAVSFADNEFGGYPLGELCPSILDDFQIIEYAGRTILMFDSKPHKPVKRQNLLDELRELRVRKGLIEDDAVDRLTQTQSVDHQIDVLTSIVIWEFMPNTEDQTRSHAAKSLRKHLRKHAHAV